MGLQNWFFTKFSNWLNIQNAEITGVGDSSDRARLIGLNDQRKEKCQLENFAWWSADSDLIQYFYQYVLKTIGYDLDRQEIRPAYMDYFWYTNDEQVKKTHSGLPRTMCDMLATCLGTPTIKGEKKLNDILAKNDFFELLHSQVSITLALGDGAYFVNIDKNQDVPIIEFADGRDVSFEWSV